MNQSTMDVGNRTVYPPNSDINGTFFLLDGDDNDPFFPPTSGGRSVSMREILIDIILPPACICGIIGLIFTLIILSHKHMATSTNTYLIGLAVADLLFLLIVSMRLWGVMVSQNDLNTWEMFTAYSETFLRMFNLVSVWMIVILAVERFIAICMPFKVSGMCTICRSRCIVVIVYVAGFLIQSPLFAKYKIVASRNEFNETEYSLHHTALSEEILFTIIYGWVLEGLIGVIIPFVLILVLNSRLIYAIHQSTKYLKRRIGINTRASYDISSEQLKITTMLIAMCVAFLACQAPYVVYNYLVSIQPRSLRGKYHLSIMAFSILLAAVKSSVNFILYCWFSERFWSTFKSIVCLRCGQQYLHSVPKSPPPRNSSDSNTKETTI